MRSALARALPWLVVLALVSWSAWQAGQFRPPRQVLRLQGQTMGTVYSVTLTGRQALQADALQALVEARLAQLNKVLSTWDPESELSRLNRAPAGQPMALSPDLAAVLRAALHLAEDTGGLLDVTVGPLVNLWGFGPPQEGTPPTDVQIAEARRRVGHHLLRLEGDTLTKLAEGMYIDLSAIAKGYAVDRVLEELQAWGIADVLVNIGGDLRAAGVNAEGKPWRVGIETPRPESGFDTPPLERLPVRDAALATSGSYRRYRKAQAGQVHHLIDPRTGRPTPSPLVSASVLAADAMRADGLATAMMVMGPDAGLRYAEAHPGIEVLFIEESAPGHFTVRHSPGFPLADGTP